MLHPHDDNSVLGKISNLTGIQKDQVTFISTQFLALCLAPLFCTVLHPSKTSTSVRHTVSLVVGIFLGFFCFGRQLFHLFTLSTICYILLRTIEPLRVQWIILGVSLTYLSVTHLYRLVFEYASYTLDITGPLMVTVQKLTSLAFILHDNVKSKKEDSKENKPVSLISSVPSPLEFYSYVLNFQTLLVGPLVFYDDFTEWIQGNNFTKHKKDKTESSQDSVPIPFLSIFMKIAASAVFGFIYVLLSPKFPVSKLKDDEFLEKWSVVEQFFYIYMCTSAVRCMYYHAWLLTDGICNASGLGFNGYDENGNSRWDLITNVDVFRFEFGSNLKDIIDGWNKGTNRWLRLAVYNRTTKYKTVLTFLLSALWHGFYPGYYMTFATGALFISAARTIRRRIRPYFLSNSSYKLFYDMVTIFTTRVALAYMIFPFVLLEFGHSLRIYVHMFLWMHVAAVAVIFLLPLIAPHEPQTEPFMARLTQLSNRVTSGIHG